jgi:hypothetical protein
MVDLLVTLWDSKQGGFQKVTRTQGNDIVENPWINMIACTTPSWIAGTFPDYMIGGGFTSRVLFVFCDTKEKYISYPARHVPRNMQQQEDLLIQDLCHIAENIKGPYQLTDEAIAWGEEWYHEHYSTVSKHVADDRFGGYRARKQTHIHKLAMVLAASQRDELVITKEDLVTSNAMITDLEPDMARVFEKIGLTEESRQTERFIKYVQSNGAVRYEEAYRYVHSHFTNLKDFENIVAGALRAGYIELDATTGFLKAKVQLK